jgi:hypothetical protein
MQIEKREFNVGTPEPDRRLPFCTEYGRGVRLAHGGVTLEANPFSSDHALPILSCISPKPECNRPKCAEPLSLTQQPRQSLGNGRSAQLLLCKRGA